MKHAALTLLMAAALTASVVAGSVKTEALIGLARTERDSGNTARAVELFRQVDAIEPLAGPILIEFFWAAASAGDPATAAIGARVLRFNPALAPVRDRLIDLAIRAADESQVARLSEEGTRLFPAAAVWNRRLGERALRLGLTADAVVRFDRASRADDATPEDHAQLALALEVSGAAQAADQAWTAIDEAVWQSRPDWIASRFRSLRHAAPAQTAVAAMTAFTTTHADNAVVREMLVDLLAASGQPARALAWIGPLVDGPNRPQWLRREASLADQTGARPRAVRALEALEAAGEATSGERWQRARLLASLDDGDALTSELAVLQPTECSIDLLDVLDRLSDPARLMATVSARPRSCPSQSDWRDRAVSRAVAVGRHEQALHLLSDVVAPHEATVDQLGLYGRLLVWTAKPTEAIPFLEEAWAAAPSASEVAEALVDAYRSLGRADDAWRIASTSCMRATEPSRRLACADLALDVRRPEAAWELTRFTATRRADVVAIGSIRGRAALILGRPAEARSLLEPVVAESQRAADRLAVVDAVRAVEGPEAALTWALSWSGESASDKEILARRALLLTELGQRDEARRTREVVEKLDPARGTLLQAEIDLAERHPQQAAARLVDAAGATPFDPRVVELYATARAEAGQYGEALEAVARLRRLRPDDGRWEIAEADWEARRHCTPEAVAHLEQLSSRYGDTYDARLVLGRAYVRAGQFASAVSLLTSNENAESQAALEVIVESLEALGQGPEALKRLANRPLTSYGLLVAYGRLLAANGHREMARTIFARVASRDEANARLFEAWAEVAGSYDESQTILTKGSTRFPADARLFTTLALGYFGHADYVATVAAAGRAIDLDGSILDAWTIDVDALRESGSLSALESVLTRFEARFRGEEAALLGMADHLASRTGGADDANVGRALTWIDSVTSKTNRSRALMVRARLLSSTGRWSDALDALAPLTAAEAPEPPAMKMRAELLSYRGEHQAAIAAYDLYLALEPGDLEARRQQARVEGWRGRYDSALDRYSDLASRAPSSPEIAAEIAAKRAYYAEDWRHAVENYKRWLSLEPTNAEARFELAQSYARIGEFPLALAEYRTLAERVPPHRQAIVGSRSLEAYRHPQAGVQVSVEASTGYGDQRLIERREALANLRSTRSTTTWSFGAGRVGAGSPQRTFDGYGADGHLALLLASAWRVSGGLSVREYDGLAPPPVAASAAIAWRPSGRIRVTGSVDRSPFFENIQTLENGLSRLGPSLAVRYGESGPVMADARIAAARVSDGNFRTDLSVNASRRLTDGGVEWKLVGRLDALTYREARASYFSPDRFWRAGPGIEGRHWLRRPDAFGDREGWIDFGYRVERDSQAALYQTLRAGTAYDFTTGIAFGGEWSITRSPVYNETRASVNLYVKRP